MKIWNLSQLEARKFSYVPFEREWFDLFGKTQFTGNWIVYGKSGQGKTAFTLRLAKAFNDMGKKVLFIEMEMGAESDFISQLHTFGIRSDITKNFTVSDGATLEELSDRLSQQRSADVIFIDSVQYMHDLYGASGAKLIELSRKYPNKVFIYISHVDGKEVDGSTAYEIKRDSMKRIYIEGFLAKFIGRGAGGPTRRYIIWDEGYRNYYIKNKENEEKDN